MDTYTRAAEAGMESFWAHKENGELDESLLLLSRLGYEAEAISTALNPDSYYFPNIKHNQISKPKSVSDDLIPVVALQNGITYQFAPHGLHSLQKSVLTNRGYSESDIKTIETELSRRDGSIESAGGSAGAGSVYTNITNVIGNGPASVDSLPTVIFNANQQGAFPEDLTSVALHEIVHVTQTLDSPFRTVDDEIECLQREIEAYSVQAKLVGSYVVPYTLGTAMAGEVDLFRQRYLGKELYTVTDEFLMYARQDAIVGKIVK